VIKSSNSNPISSSLRRVSLVSRTNIQLTVDLAQHYFVKANVTAIRRVRKTDNNRIARAVGATIVNRVEDIRESDVGVGCGLFNIEKIGDEYI
jgi:chaperonin GroEL (HSP60 family)